jgi:hypothetical protein
MEPTQEMVDELFRERIRRGGDTPPDQKILDSLRSFDLSCRLMDDGIRHEFPDADDAEVRRIRSERINRIRKLEEYGIYVPVETVELYDGNLPCTQ